MVPVVMAPALVVLFYADIKAKRLLVVEGPLPATPLGLTAKIESRSPWQILLTIWSAIDAFGLILLGFSWTLVLLPFTLSASANDGYKNRTSLPRLLLHCWDGDTILTGFAVAASLIDMFVVGGILLVIFAIYEWFFAANPILPRRIINR